MIPQPNSSRNTTSSLILWIDQVGGYLVFPEPSLTLGRVTPDRETDRADVCIQANLSTRHITITRTRESYLLEPHAECLMNGREVTASTSLFPHSELKLRGNVKLLFRQPTRLSLTATLQLLSSHRFANGVNGIILLEQACLLGAGESHHVQCPEWNDELVLFRQRGEFFCQQRHPNQREKSIPVPLNENIRLGKASFRLEPIN